MLDICYRCDKNKKITYVWFDTGLEYQATKDHLDYLREKYSIEIIPYKAIKPIPLSCREYGQPFKSKFVSEMIGQFQNHGFGFEDKTYDELILQYPRCKGPVTWWTNNRDVGEYGYSMFNINYNKWLKEFMMQNPPTFKIGSKCCDYAKKNVSHKLFVEQDFDMKIVGIRKAEGGIRSTKYKTCFGNENGVDTYRPLFWYSNNDRAIYEDYFGIIHSDCYLKYGFIRTGCACCPYGKEFEEELLALKKYEPRMYKAVNNIFGDSYEYTRKYKEFCKEMDAKYGSYKEYLRIKEQ